MRTIEISDEAYQTLSKFHGDVTAYVEKMATEAHEVAAVQEGVAAYQAGDVRPLKEFGKELHEGHGIALPEE